MNKLLLLSALGFSMLSGFSQGTITFNNRVVGSIVTHIYEPLYGASYVSQIGNGTADFPPGTTSWQGWTLIGARGINGDYGGATTYAQLLIAPGYNQPESSLVPASTIATFRTGAAAGFIQGGITITASNVAGDSPATVEMVAWDNSSGHYPTWSDVLPAVRAGVPMAYGLSGTWNTVLGGTSTPPNITGARSFNLILTPEPSTVALASLSVLMLLAFRRTGH
jgi:hypothetical protein